MGSRLILSSGFTKRRVIRRARSHTARKSGGVATGGERTASWWAHISSAGRNVKGASAYIKTPFSFPNSDFAAQSELRLLCTSLRCKKKQPDHSVSGP